MPLTSARFDRGTTIRERYYLSGPSVEAISALCTLALDACRTTTLNTGTKALVWHSDYWHRASYSPTRGFDSVVIDETVMTELRTDLDDFVAEETKKWYDEHRIPFRRGYMFHGPPARAKSSLIAAIASYLKRRVYRLSLTSHRLTDDSLFNAMSLVRSDGIVIFEGVDALFNRHRERRGGVERDLLGAAQCD